MKKTDIDALNKELADATWIAAMDEEHERIDRLVRVIHSAMQARWCEREGLRIEDSWIAPSLHKEGFTLWLSIESLSRWPLFMNDLVELSDLAGLHLSEPSVLGRFIEWRLG